MCLALLLSHITDPCSKCSGHAQDCFRPVARDSRLMPSALPFPSTEEARAHRLCIVPSEQTHPDTHLLGSNAPANSLPLFPCRPPSPQTHTSSIDSPVFSKLSLSFEFSLRSSLSPQQRPSDKQSEKNARGVVSGVGDGSKSKRRGCCDVESWGWRFMPSMHHCLGT
jgi:hypothetical protein